MRALIFIPVLTSLGCVLSASDINLEAPIVKVRVHPDEAWVSRVARVTARAGSQRYRVADLPSGLTLDDVRVSVKGAEGTRLGNVAVSNEPRKLNQSEAWKKLDAESKTLNRENIRLMAQQMALEDARKVLREIQASKGGEGANRPAYLPPDPQSLLDLSRRVQADCEVLFEREKRVMAEQDKLNEKSNRISKAMEKLKNQDQKEPSVVSVEVSSPMAGEFLIEIQTRTKEARWKPSYESRLSEDRKAMELICLASVSQLSGEDWNGVTVEIAHAQTTRNLDAPKPRAGVSLSYQAPLPPPPPLPIRGGSSTQTLFLVDGIDVLNNVPASGHHLNGVVFLAPGITPENATTGMIAGVVVGPQGQPIPGAEVRIKGPTMPGDRVVRTDSTGNFRFPLLPPGDHTLVCQSNGYQSTRSSVRLAAGVRQNLVVRLSAESTAVVMVVASGTPEDEEAPAPALERADARIEDAAGLSRTYVLEGAKDIPSDAEPHRFTVTRSTFAPDLTLRSVPRISADVYLLATVQPDVQFPWFPGSPVVVFRGGDRLGELTLQALSPGQPVRFSFGPLPGVQVQRQILEARTESVGAFGQDRAWLLKQRFAGSNERDESLEIEIQEPGLRANSKQLKIELLLESAIAKEDKRGVKTWTLKLPAHRNASVEESLRVRAPHTGTIPELSLLGLPQSD